MTYNELKNDLELVKDRRYQIRSICSELLTLREDYLTKVGCGAIDYSRDRLQSSPDPDRAIIAVLDEIDRETAKRKNKIEELTEANAFYEDKIFCIQGIRGEVLRLYYLEGWTMEKISRHVHFNQKYCWRFRSEGLNAILDKIEAEERRLT